MTPFLGGTGFYATLFCVLSGESKVRERDKVEIKGFPFLVMGHLGWDKLKRKVGHLQWDGVSNRLGVSS